MLKNYSGTYKPTVCKSGQKSLKNTKSHARSDDIR